jgi:hypothetical protein
MPESRTLQLGRRRETTEPRFVEAVAAYPGVGGQPARRGANGGEQRRDILERGAVEMRVPCRQREEMEMGVDQPREDGRAAAVDALGARSHEIAQIASGPDAEDRPAPERDGTCRGPTRIERDDPCVLEQPVCGANAQSDEGSGLASFTFIS